MVAKVIKVVEGKPSWHCNGGGLFIWEESGCWIEEERKGKRGGGNTWDKVKPSDVSSSFSSGWAWSLVSIRLFLSVGGGERKGLLWTGGGREAIWEKEVCHFCGWRGERGGTLLTEVSPRLHPCTHARPVLCDLNAGLFTNIFLLGSFCLQVRLTEVEWRPHKSREGWFGDLVAQPATTGQCSLNGKMKAKKNFVAFLQLHTASLSEMHRALTYERSPNLLMYVVRLVRKEGGRRGICNYPTNIASVHLMMGCPNSRAGVRMVEKIPLEPPEQPKFRSHH